jgi:hypothetical protein
MKNRLERLMPRSRLPTAWNPNTSLAERDSAGNLTLRRFFGGDGKAIKNIDYDHDHGAGMPHAHDWDWTKDPPRQSGRPLKSGE